jgi:hypothetical protein
MKTNPATRIGMAFNVLAVLLFLCVAALAQENFGTVVGTVTDASGGAVPNATVTLVGERLPRGIEVKTDSSGSYTAAALPVGLYSATVTAAGFTTTRVQDLEVKLGTPVTFSPRLKVGQITETVEVNTNAIQIDTTATANETTVGARDIDSMSKGRTFNTLLAIAPGVRTEIKGGNAGVGGISVDGASGLENTYFLDGVEVSDVLSGALRSGNAIPLDFITQLQISSGGFNAEYGGATGGVINVAIKSGQNAFHGEVGTEYTGSGLNASDRGYWQRSPLGAGIADFFKPKEDSYSIWYPTATLGGRIIKDKLFFFIGYDPEVEHTDRNINYASGARTFTQDRLRHYSVSRLDYSASNKLQLCGSWLWSPQRRSGNLPNRDPRVAAPSNDQSVLGGWTPYQAVNGGATFLVTPRLTVSARYGYKYLNDKDGNYGVPGDPYVVYNTASSEAGAPVPTPGGNGYSNVSSTLTTFRDITTRHNLYLDGTFIANFHGQHSFKVGYDLNRVSNDVATDYTNGDFNIFWGGSFTRGSVTGAKGAYGYYTWEDGVRLNSKVNGRNQGVYFQDTWRVTPRITINAGIRLENEYLPPYKAEQGGVKVANPVSFNWGDKIAPRLGVAWDVLGDGKWKVSGSFGLFFDTLKYNLARGSFGGEYWVTHVYTLDSPNVLSLSKGSPGTLGKEIIAYDNRTIPINAQGQIDGIEPNLKPYESRDFSAGVEHQIAPRMIASVRYTRKDLLQTIEDIGVLDSQDNEVYLTGNPGGGLTRNASSVFGGKTPNGNFLVPPAVRQYDAVEFRLRGNIGNLLLIPSYTWSRLYGNYSGLGNSDESGRSNPNNNRSFDLPYYYFDQTGSQKNVYGLLGTDRPNTFKMFSSYDIKSKLGVTNIGVNQLIYQGTNDSTTFIYLSAPTYPLGRGDIPRTPVYTQTDLTVFHDFSITERVKARLGIDVWNLFNQDAVISRASQLNRSGAISSAVLPISQFFAGYDVNKFVFPGNKNAPYNPIYGLPGASYRAGGGPGTTLSSAFAATNHNFGAYQDFRTLRLQLRISF